MKHSKLSLIIVLLALLLQACATPNRTIGAGALAGAAIGAGIGYNLVDEDADEDKRTTTTIVSSMLVGLLTAGFLAWHYRELEQTKVELSGQYARLRLGGPTNLGSNFTDGIDVFSNREVIYQIAPDQVSELAISLDKDTKWLYPQFRKRYLMPERSENQLISRGYIWEIVKPGYFITRSQNPDFFLEPKPEPPHESDVGPRSTDDSVD